MGETMTATMTNTPMINYLAKCKGGRDVHIFWKDEKQKEQDLGAAREYANKIKAQNHGNVRVEQRNNRVIISIEDPKLVDIWDV